VGSFSGYIPEVLIPPGSELVAVVAVARRLQRRFDVDVLETPSRKEGASHATLADAA